MCAISNLLLLLDSYCSHQGADRLTRWSVLLQGAIPEVVRQQHDQGHEHVPHEGVPGHQHRRALQQLAGLARTELTCPARGKLGQPIAELRVHGRPGIEAQGTPALLHAAIGADEVVAARGWASRVAEWPEPHVPVERDAFVRDVAAPPVRPLERARDAVLAPRPDQVLLHLLPPRRAHVPLGNPAAAQHAGKHAAALRAGVAPRHADRGRVTEGSEEVAAELHERAPWEVGHAGEEEAVSGEVGDGQGQRGAA